jgi:hypothetical protein
MRWAWASQSDRSIRPLPFTSQLSKYRCIRSRCTGLVIAKSPRGSSGRHRPHGGGNGDARCVCRAGERIRADYRAWQALAEQYVCERRSDAVVEIAPASAAAFTAGAMLYRQAGYRIELVVLGVRAADSLQGTAKRYARLCSHGAPARFTTAGGHDAHFTALSDAVAAAEDTHVVDAVTVLRRDATVVYRNERRPDGSWARPAGVVTALLIEQARPYAEAEAARLWAVQRRLRAAMPHYRDALYGIARRARPLMPVHLQPHRLTGPAAVAALPARPYEPGVCSSFSRAA